MPRCESCKIARSDKSIQLPGGWAVTQYTEDEAYLGWMVILPVAHRMSLASLSDEESVHFMPNVKEVEAAIQSYWTDDKIERFYIVYYAESLLMGHPYHLHIHLIPRFASIETKAWDMPKAAKEPGFPERYQKTPERINALLAHVRDHLPNVGNATA